MVGVRSSVRAVQRAARASAFEVTKAAADLGFRGEHRLRKTDEFSSVFAFRKTLRGKNFDMLYRPGLSGSARLGVVIGKKFVRSAVNRNMVRRIVRESFRLSRAQLPPNDIVVRVSARIAAPEKGRVREEIDELFSRLCK